MKFIGPRTRKVVKDLLPYVLVKKYQDRSLEKLPFIDMPEIYNKNCDLMKTYYLANQSFVGSYSATWGRTPQYIYWDRGNFQLKNHFYVCNDVIDYSRFKADKKYAMIIEPKSIIPKVYDYFNKNPHYFDDYEIVFTHSEELLNKLTNAKLLIWGGVYYGTQYGGGGGGGCELYLNKKKNISIVSSNKRACELHKLRFDLAMKYRSDNKVDCFGTFEDNRSWVKIADTLEEYRYSIVVENHISKYWMTEKLMNCFAAMTVPIYIGATSVSDFFNPDGIIQVSPTEAVNSLDNIIANCCKEDYDDRISSIIDNYERVKNYLCFEDWLYNTYKDILP